MSGEAARLRAAADAESDHDGVRAVLDEALARIEALEAERGELMAIIDQMARLRGLAPGEIVAVPRDLRDRPEKWEAEMALSFGRAPKWLSAHNSWWDGRDKSARAVCRPSRPTEETR